MSYLLAVEDSLTDRMLIQRMIGKAFSDLEVRFASDPFEARELISQDKPAVVLLDLSLPKMSGADFLGALMRSYPLPVIVVTGNCQVAGATTDELIEIGAISVIEKPSAFSDVQRFEQQVTDAVEAAVHLEVREEAKRRDRDGHLIGQPRFCKVGGFTNDSTPRNDVDVIAIGSSTGGPQALNAVLSSLPSNCPPVVIAQHISASFVASLVERLNANSPLNVVLADDNIRLQRGHAYVASPMSHLEIVSSSRTRLVERSDDDPFSPSVDRLFHSLAEFKPHRVIGCVLTGMGNDGANGLLELCRRGGRTIAQDESTSAVFGMPARAAECGAANEVLPVDEIADRILKWCSERQPALTLASS